MQGTLCISTPCETISPDPLQDSLYPALCGIPVLTLRWCSSCPSGANFLPAWQRPACLLRYHRPAGFPLSHFFFFFTTNARFMRALVLFPVLTLARFSHDRPQLVSQHWKEAFHCRLYKPTDLGGCHRWVVAVLAHPCEGRGNCRRCFECVALSTSERFRDVAVLYWRVIPCTHACRGFLGRCNLLLRPSVAYWVLTASNLRLNSI